MSEAAARTGPRAVLARPQVLAPGALAGAVAFLLGYAATYLAEADRVERGFAGLNALLDLVGGGGVETPTAVSWLYYGAHGVAVAYPLPGGGRATRNLVAASGATDLLYLLPPVLLVAAGFALARRAGERGAGRAALVGASVLPGYLALAVAGLLATRVTVVGATVGPDLLTGVLLAGVAYPVVLGGLGGVVASRVR